MKTAIIIFPGSNCDKDGIDGLGLISNNIQKIWHKESKLDDDLDLILIPGGFSYGDYLRSGGIAANSNIMPEIIRLANRGVKIIGICNGFQILTEAGLLDGALMKNQKGKFICQNVHLSCQNKATNFTNQIDKIIQIPVAHMDGNYYCCDNLLKNLEDNNQIAFRYCDEMGDINNESNPNGSKANIAGIFNKNKNILGMMPHPERAIDANVSGLDGLLLFNSLLN
ncbi:phosphoribosylformylglycinamidine synthase subunit PurQ [Rickettsiales bacterium]|nr:phosphoribosylformylglycinamidine synthase subunit PurQ [Rickettsiales bacterium]